MAFNFIGNTAAILSLASSGIEACSRGARRASVSADNAVAIKDIKNYTGDSLLNVPSEKYNTMKEINRKSDFTTGFYKAGGAISGFCKGAYDSLANNVFSLGFSALTLGFKNKTVKSIGLIGLAASTAWDFLKNGTNLFTKTNSIEK